jgi:hypothetical protein
MTNVSSNKKGSGTLQQQIIEVMTDSAKPTELWLIADIMDSLGITKVQADNALANAWKTNKICRHKINANPDAVYGGSARYALKIKEEDKQYYSVSPRASAISPTGKKRKGQKASAKEIRFAFVEMQRALTRLEDLIMPVVEDAEEKDKALEKLRNIL